MLFAVGPEILISAETLDIFGATAAEYILLLPSEVYGLWLS